MVAHFSSHSLHSLSRYSSQGVFSHPSLELIVSITFPLSENDQLSSFWIFFSSFGFSRPLKTSGAVHFPPPAFSLVDPNESIPDPQLIRAHWRIIRQSSSPLVSSQTCRCQTHAPNTTIAILPPLMTIRHCICKATVSCPGSDLVHSSMPILLYVQSHWHQCPNSK
ncbi:uncharacterized protein TNCV_1317381 [Trichonephila clavipes]|nr:uncharacterized protein TNCV_1317381 [Trichonephila clavipes]